MGDPTEGLLVVRDLLDGQLMSADGRRVGRVADVVGELDGNEVLRLRAILVGPQALAGRLSYRLRGPLSRVLHDRFDHEIPLAEVVETGPTIRLRGRASDYPTGGTERNIARRILRFIPGSGSPDDA